MADRRRALGSVSREILNWGYGWFSKYKRRYRLGLSFFVALPGIPRTRPAVNMIRRLGVWSGTRKEMISPCAKPRLYDGWSEKCHRRPRRYLSITAPSHQ